jgi:rod shape-determining protein MreC
LLDIQREPPTKKILARILIRPSTPWGETCTIGVGKLQGVIPGAAVFAGAGLVGQVFRVTQSSSQVLLLRDHRNAVDSFTQRTRTAGICSGQTDELLRMDYISPDADVKSGDVVISSGQGGVFPKGIRIGTIVRIRNDAARHFQTADVRPSVEFRSLEEAFVVVNR